MTASWGAAMQAALAATLARPEWWVVSLAAFLVRGGILLVALPIIAFPSAASLATMLSPSLMGVIIGTPTASGFFLGGLAAILFLGFLGALGLAGAWLDMTLVGEAARDEDLDLGWSPRRTSPWRALAARLVAHAPTAIVAGVAGARLVAATYAELLSPGDPSLPVVSRVIARAPDAIVVPCIAWLVGESVGGLAARRAAAGESLGTALGASVRQAFGLRGLATLATTTLVVVGLAAPYALGVGRAWEHLRGVLLDGFGDPVQLGAAVLLFGATWVLGLGLLAAGLAFRATAWTVEAAPRLAPVPEPARDAAPEGVPG